MTNKHLKKYQESKPYIIREGKPSTVCKSQKRADELFHELGNRLASEILWEDGECSATRVRQKEKMYNNVIKELLQNGWSIRGEALNTDAFYHLKENADDV